MTLSAELVTLAHAYGVSTSFTDWRGRTVEVSTETVTTVLTALGVDVSDPAAAIVDHELAPWRRMLPPSLVTVAGRATTCWVHVRDGDPAELNVELEGGGSHALRQVDSPVRPREVDGALVGEAVFEVPGDLPLGYHVLRARSGSQEATADLVVTPAWLGLPPHARTGRHWGFAAQLYSVRSEESWGIGDLTDLTDLAVWSAGLGADYLLVNPLHAAEPLAPLEPSPYLPSSRRFFHPLYLRVERIPEYAALPAAERDAVELLPLDLPRALAPDEILDRDAAWTAKRAALRMVHAVPRTPGRELDLAAFRGREGEALTRFAAWWVLAEDHGPDSRTWPPELRDVDSPEVAAYAREHVDRIDFACWLQWLLDEQLQHAQAKARGAGMRLGTMHDLAVGVHPGGADAWRMPDVYATGVTVGAPPDAYNQMGQNWNQPPWRPERLAELGYAPFRDLVRAVLRHAGGVRVDHILGLFRLWFVPAGRSAAEGAYVTYDHEALVGVLALEAHRAGAVVVGEDLGVVAPETRRYLRERGVLGTSILWFERDGAGDPLTAEQWREWCLASVTTHDLPPTTGYLASDHVHLQHRLGLLERGLSEELASAAADRETWLAEVRRRVPDDDVVVALHRYLALTPARMLCVALTDAVGDRRTQNQPGTTDEYPNWRIPLADDTGRPILLEDVFASSRAAAVARAVTGSR